MKKLFCKHFYIFKGIGKRNTLINKYSKVFECSKCKKIKFKNI